MPGTTADGWPYVLPADHPLEFPAASQQLANLLDSRIGPGLVVHTSFASIPDLAVTGTGVRDLATLGQTVTFPYPTTSIAVSTMFGGFATGTADFLHDMFGFAANAVVKAAQSVQAPAGKWTVSPVVWGWTNATNASCGYKTRVNLSAISAGTFHTGGSQILVVIGN